MVAKWIGRLAIVLAVIVAVAIGAAGAIIAFDEPPVLPRLTAADSLPGFSSWNLAEIPRTRQLQARDGAPLAYRFYPGPKERAVVLVHGSSGTNVTMHRLAQALQSSGATVYSISLRGHGGSGTRNGDSSYSRQLDDDLMDFVQKVGLNAPGVHRTLMGFSSGGGFVLRTASGPNAASFDAYVALSPYVAHDSPTSRQDAGGWAGVAMGRLLMLAALDGLGLPWFQGLPVVRFATDAKPSDSRTPVYSYRLMSGMQLGPAWRLAIARIRRPTLIVVGADDELFLAGQFSPLFGELNRRISVSILPDAGHMTMIADERAVSTIADLWRGL
jgi:non-heme chloroperoxidase